MVIVVAYDWRSRSWRWWLEPGGGQSDFVLHLPGGAPFAIEKGTHQRGGEPPGRGAMYVVTFREGGEERRWEGHVVELNLDHSERVYGRALSADEILGSWRGRALPVDSESNERGPGEGDGEEVQRELAAAFDAVNLYDLYRSMRALRAKLQRLNDHPERQRALLVGRPDSVMALARLASGDGAVPVVRYLVLRELCGVMRAWDALLDEALVGRVEELASDARARTRGRLSEELGAERGAADAMLGWFEDRLSEIDGVKR
ncbi:hypothetical protein FRC98_07055 [Lujinxingia vulgaris]|uniref:Uncharacterized protein n=1 Tax=Lujinxingia vulgaris TaxID=2600176 RepID=A0A5C6X7Z6_9DELT|nr:hypothetical protein [Lujinxingia vulgaris]TXD37448.1 hypothetical protein FRC98_07055 [Lujinxingia vulgaris]